MNSKDIKPWHERGSVNAGGWVQKDYAPKYNATEIVMLEEISDLRQALEAAEAERDQWAAKWQAVRRGLAQARYPGMTKTVRALSKAKP